MEQTGPNYHVRALSRGLEVLRALRGGDSGITLPQLHERTGLPKGTLVRLLSVLEEEGFALRLDERPSWTLGYAVIELATERSGDGLPMLARGPLAELADATRWTANLGVLDGSDVLHVCVEEPVRALRFRSTTGSRDDTYCTGLGKALLAFIPPDEVEDHLPPEPFAARTEHTLTSRKKLDAELEEIRRRGWASDEEEGDVGVWCMAIPLRLDGECVGALSVAGPAGEVTARSTNERLRALRQTAKKIEKDPVLSRTLGATARSLRLVSGIKPAESNA